MDQDLSFRLDGQTALVTGASSGLGRHLAGVLARAGARVALAARRLELAEEAARELRAEGHIATSVFLDVTDTQTIGPAFDAAEQGCGSPVQILINNAGILHFAKFVDHDDADVAKVLDTNLKGAFAVAREAARRMTTLGCGSIVNIASTAGLRAGGFLSAYAASKAGLIHLSEVMALELAGKGVRVNVVCPGNFVTDMHQVFAERGVDEGIIRRIPQRRFGEPRDLDGPVLLLASDAGRYMTGSIVKVDGGQTLSWL